MISRNGAHDNELTTIATVRYLLVKHLGAGILSFKLKIVDPAVRERNEPIGGLRVHSRILLG